MSQANDAPENFAMTLERSASRSESRVKHLSVNLSESAVTTPDAPSASGLIQTESPSKKGYSFWITIFIVNVAYFVALLETSAISTPLPTIINRLHGSNYIWAGSAYNVAATAIMPSTGGVAEALGRRPVILASLLMFSLGSAICGAANTDKLFIAGRAVQGVGGAGLFSMSNIILSDIVPLNERGAFNGFLQLTWCIAAGIGPAIGGALGQSGQWRWLFYMNIPIAGTAVLLTIFFMKLKAPEGSLKEKLCRIDIVGSILVTSSTVAMTIPLTWGGSLFPWSSPSVLVPLILGALGFIAFIVYEGRWAKFPLAPLNLFSNRTSLSGYLQSSIAQIPFSALIFYLPIYFQACEGSGPLHSGVLLLALAFSVAPSSIIVGLSVKRSGRYRPQLWLGWAIVVPALALLGTTDVNTPIRNLIGYQILAGVGFGSILSATYFPVLSAVPTTMIAPALAFFAFVKQFGQIWSITIAGSILQNVLARELPPHSSPSGAGANGAFALIPELPLFPQQQLALIRKAFADGIQLVWQVGLGFTGLGLLISFLMRGLPLHAATDKKWGITEKESRAAQGEGTEKDSAQA